MDNTELKEMIDYMHLVCTQVPRGLEQLNDALVLAIFDLTALYSFGRRTKNIYKALIFCQSIPRFTDFESDEFADWLIHDEAYIEYLPD